MSEELQITRHRIDEAQEAADAKVNMLNIEVDHFKAENEKLLTQLEDIKQEKFKNLHIKINILGQETSNHI